MISRLVDVMISELPHHHIDQSSRLHITTFILPLMKIIQTVLFLAILLLAACTTNRDYEVSTHLSSPEQEAFKKSIIRYVAPLPEKANEKNRFDVKFDAHYDRQTDRVRLDKYFPSPDGYVYFEVSRIAPSFKVKRAATAGRIKYDAAGEIEEYEEVYRTWKMEEEELSKKTELLFDTFVTGKDLTLYLTANSEEEYIEFPDNQVKYDKELRSWVGNDRVLQADPCTAIGNNN